MKTYIKAAMYDELLKDFEELVNELEAYKNDVDNIPSREDIKEHEESSGLYYAACTGAYRGYNSGLGIKLAKHQGILNWYKSKK
jgi:hypothetical protein